MLLKKLRYCPRRSMLRRCFSAGTTAKEIPDKDASSKSHLFQRYSFHNYQELCSHLIDNMIFNENGLIVLNKPNGLKKGNDKKLSSAKQVRVHPSVSNIDHLSFAEALPYLASHLQVDRLNLVKLSERYISGVSLLSSDDIATKKIKKCFAVSTEPLFTYLAICVGIPKFEENSEKLGITLNVQDNEKKVIYVDTYSKRSSKRELVTPFVVRHRTLSVNEDLKVALLQITINRNKWHGLRLYCATRLFAPCLGDWLMGSRVKYINNIPILTDPHHPGTNSSQSLPNSILAALHIEKNYQDSIPLHLHLAQIKLPRYRGSEKTFIAKPPEYFLWSCEKMGVSVPDFFLKNHHSTV